MNTKIPVDNYHELEKGFAKPDCVYMDSMGMGMGCCCLQLTFQACCITEARTLYDQLAPLCPIMVSINNCPYLIYILMFFVELANKVLFHSDNIIAFNSYVERISNKL